MISKKCFWKNHIATWENSGIFQAEYCRKHGLSYKSFGYNKRKVPIKTEMQKVVPVPNIAVRPDGAAQSYKPIRVCVGGRFHLEIEPGLSYHNILY